MGNINPKVIIIGGGIGGSAAALRAAQYNIPTVWIVGDRQTEKCSRGRWVVNIDNMIGVHPNIVLGKLREKWKEDQNLIDKINNTGLRIGTNDIIKNVKERLGEFSDVVQIVEARAVHAKKESNGLLCVETSSEQFPSVKAPYVVLSTGVMDKQPKVAKDKDGKLMDEARWVFPFANQESLLYCIRCEGHLTRNHRVAVIGYSETAAQVAVMLAERYNSVFYLLTNGETLQVEDMTLKLLHHYGINVQTKRLTDIHAKETNRGHLDGFTLEDGTKIDVNYAVVSLGLHRVYNDLARELDAELIKSSLPEDQRRVLIDKQSETSVKNLFAVGDMAVRQDEQVMMQIYTAQEYAVRAIDSIDRRIRLSKRKEVLEAL